MRRAVGELVCLVDDHEVVRRGVRDLLESADDITVAGDSVTEKDRNSTMVTVYRVTGSGAGSREAYARMTAGLEGSAYDGVTFHYLMPDVVWHNKILWILEALPSRPLLVADAGFMYAAKMSGFAAHYDLFTPDAGEMAFLADEVAPHPFYTRGFLLQEEERIPELIPLAYAAENSALHLLIKGRTDYVVAEGAIIAADIASKSGDIAMDFIDRFTGCVLFTGDVAAVESSLEGTVRTLATVLGFTPAPLTRT